MLNLRPRRDRGGDIKAMSDRRAARPQHDPSRTILLDAHATKEALSMVLSSSRGLKRVIWVLNVILVSYLCDEGLVNFDDLKNSFFNSNLSVPLS